MIGIIISSVVSGAIFGISGYLYGKRVERETYLDDKYEDLIKSYQEENSEEFHPKFY
jgi:hypothetical protein